jgi:hypothetical protein
MERRATPRNTVLMSGAIEFASSTINCLIRNISISGAALDVTNPHDIPEHFNLVAYSAKLLNGTRQRFSVSATPANEATRYCGCS